MWKRHHHSIHLHHNVAAPRIRNEMCIRDRFWDNYSPTLFTDNEVETSFRSEVGDCVDYYFMYGKNADGVIAQVRSCLLYTSRGG